MSDALWRISAPLVVLSLSGLSAVVWYGAQRIVGRLDSLEMALSQAQATLIGRIQTQEVRLVVVDERLAEHLRQYQNQQQARRNQ